MQSGPFDSIFFPHLTLIRPLSHFHSLTEVLMDEKCKNAEIVVNWVGKSEEEKNSITARKSNPNIIHNQI